MPCCSNWAIVVPFAKCKMEESSEPCWTDDNDSPRGNMWKHFGFDNNIDGKIIEIVINVAFER